MGNPWIQSTDFSHWEVQLSSDFFLQYGNILFVKSQKVALKKALDLVVVTVPPGVENTCVEGFQ